MNVRDSLSSRMPSVFLRGAVPLWYARIPRKALYFRGLTTLEGIMSSLDQISPGTSTGYDQPAAYAPAKPKSIWRRLMWLSLYGLLVMAISSLLTWNLLRANSPESQGPKSHSPKSQGQPTAADLAARMDLKPLLIDTDQLEIFYPEEWQIIEREHGARFVIQEPMVEAAGQPVGAIMYPKNITIARIRGSLPIDHAQKLILEEDLRQGFGTRSRVRNYVVQADKGGLIDLAHTKAIKMPATFTINGIPMSQLNLLVSGRDNSYLISYVDASANYIKDFPRVWQGLSLVKTTGSAPFRYRNIVLLFAAIGVFFAVMALATWWKSKRVVFDYESDVSHLLSDGPSGFSGNGLSGNGLSGNGALDSGDLDSSYDDMALAGEWQLDKA